MALQSGVVYVLGKTLVERLSVHVDVEGIEIFDLQDFSVSQAEQPV